MKKFFSVIFLIFFLTSTTFADTVYLKNGRSVSGKIMEKTDEYIKLDFEGTSLTYWADEIENVQRDRQPSQETIAISIRRPSEKQGKVFLWEAKSAKNTVYILGSIHLARPSIYPLDRRIEDAFDRSDNLAVEANIEAFDPVLLQQMFAEKGVYSDGSTIRDHLSKKTFNLASEKIRSIGLGFDQVAIFKPWFLGITLATLELLKLGFSPEYGVDRHFLRKAKGKKILELESIDYQLNLFDGFTDEQQDLFLFSTLLDLSIIEKEMNNLMNYWENGNSVKMEKILMQGLEKHPEILPIIEKIFYERNFKMTSKIEGFLDTNDTYFVVVGAGHLVGEKGIIQLLKKKGYSLQQL